MKRFFSLLLLFSSLLFAQSEGGLKKVSVQFDWKNQFEFAGFYMAKEKGFYKDVGLDVTFKEFQKGVDVTEDVLRGKSTFGVNYPTLILKQAQGEKLLLLAAILQSSPYVLVTLNNSGIKSIKDFKKKKIMISQTAQEDASFMAMFRANNLHTKDLQTLQPTFNIEDLIHHKTDIYPCYISDEIFTLQTKGIAYDIWDPKEYGFDFYDELLFTSQKEFQEHPNIVKNFKKATIKGWEYAFSHINETVNIIQKHYNTQHKSKKALLFEGETLKRLAYYKTKQLGTIKRDKIQRIYDIYTIMGLSKGKIDFNNFIYKESLHLTKLNKEEKEYLSKKKNLKICIASNLEPIQFLKNGKAEGISVDILDIICNKLHIRPQYIHTSSLEQSKQFLQSGKCDFFPNAIRKDSIDRYINFTQPLFSNDLVIVTTKDKSLVQNLHSLKDQRIAVVKGSPLLALLKMKYPKVQIIKVNDQKEVFEALEKKRADFTLSALPTLFYYKNIYHLKDIQIAGNTNLTMNIGLSVNKKNPILLDILNKEIGNISKNVKDIIMVNWASKKTQKSINYSFAYKIIAFIFILFLVLLMRYIVMKRYNKNLKEEVKSIKVDLEKKQAQLMKQSRQAQMGEMITMIAHQWRQPLAAISATSLTINFKAQMNGLDNKSAIELSDKISHYAQHLSKTIDDFRDFFKPNKEIKEVSYKKLVESVLDIVEISLENKNITLEKDLNCQRKFFTYENELKQVILNLIKNAEDILVENKIQKPFIKLQSFQEGERLILEVSDNAGGVPEDIIEKIFDPYFSTKSEKNGTGLGLYMSKTIIEEHCNGKLSVKNSAIGAIFRIELGENNANSNE